MTRKDGSIILLVDPADEPQALTVSDPGMPAQPGDKPKKEGASAGQQAWAWQTLTFSEQMRGQRRSW